MTGRCRGEGLGGDGVCGSYAPGNVEIESCAVCHSGEGAKSHQNVYDQYTDKADLALTWVKAAAVPKDGKFSTSVTVMITKNGLPYADIDGLPSLAQKRFYSVKYDADTMQHIDAVSRRITLFAGSPALRSMLGDRSQARAQAVVGEVG